MDTGFFNAVKEFKFTSRKHRISDEDAVDRINSFYTPIILSIIASVIGTKMYLVGDPIQCWIPQEFKNAWEQFAENYCWVKNTYFVPPNETIPESKIHRENEELTYYQWVPFVLALQALMFYLPSAIWKLLNWQSGVNISDLVETSIQSLDEDPKEREKRVNMLAKHIELSIVQQRSRRTGAIVRIKRILFRTLLCGYSKTGNFLTMMYLFIKALYVANVVGQFFLLNRFLGTDYKFYGVEVLRDLLQNRDWRHSGHFPRVTLCDFDIRVVGNLHPRTLQCVLVVNLFNEKAFIFLWFMLVFVAVITILDALAWLFWSLVARRRYASIKKYIKTPQTRDEAWLLNSFLAEYLRADGAFVLRIISKNAGDPVVHDVVQKLWQDYAESRKISDGSDEADAAPIADSPLLNDSRGKGTFV